MNKLKDKKIILFNGPPKSGKDFGAQYVEANFEGAILNKFAKVLKERTHALYGFHWRTHDYYEDCKNDSHKDFLGLSPRQAYINVSETYFKPTHGEKVFGILLAQELDKSEWDLVAISDSGFKGEAEVLIDKYGAENITLIRVHREGCDFSKDSRSHIVLPVKTFDIRNHGDDSYIFALHKIVHDIYNV